MKILYCKNSFAGPISGADEIVVNYALELKSTGHSPAVLLVLPPANGDNMAARRGRPSVSARLSDLRRFTRRGA